MPLPINLCLALLPAFFFFFITTLQGQSSSFHLQIEQGISALNNFNMERDKGGFGGYATSLGGECRFPSGFYLKADVQRLSAQLSFSNNYLTLNSSDTTTLGPNQAYGTTRSKEYRIAYGGGVATSWKKVRFTLDLAHSIEFHQRAETIAERPNGFFRDGGATALSRYGETFTFNDENWRLINNSNHQLQVTGSMLVELSPRIGLGLFYRTDLLTRWVELQLQDQPGQPEFVTVERRDARQAMTAVRLTYGL
jgi:hypothetical protein